MDFNCLLSNTITEYTRRNYITSSLKYTDYSLDENTFISNIDNLKT